MPAQSRNPSRNRSRRDRGDGRRRRARRFAHAARLSRNVVFVTRASAPGERGERLGAGVLAADTAVIYMGAGEAATIARR